MTLRFTNGGRCLALACLVLAASPSTGSPSAADWADATTAAALKGPATSDSGSWKDPTQPLDVRVRDLVRRLTLPEKVSLLRGDAPAVRRLGIPAYSYRNECLHGVGRAGPATVFPQAIGMAATWDTPLIRAEAEAIATEARAKHNDYVAQHQGDCATHFGLSFYTPNINIFRDPRWGRGQETYGEDPFLTARMGVAFIRGLQGDDPKYVKVMACAKHFAVHSGPEAERHEFDAQPSERDLYETYLPAFEAAVREGQVGSVMGAYNAVDGQPACANPFLLRDLLRGRWGFDGFVISDGGAIRDIWANHKYAPTPEAAAAVAVKAGCNLCSPGSDYDVLVRAVEQSLISEAEIDATVSRALAARFRLGLFDPPSAVPWSGITLAQNCSPEHQALALKVAEESIVLLKNDGVLPLRRAKLKRIAVIGANADSVAMLLGNYHGTPSHPVTILDGIRNVAGPDVEVVGEPGCPLALKSDGSNQPTPETRARAVAAATSADVVVYVGGLDPTLESEEARVPYQDFNAGDRTRIELPAVQTDLLQALQATGKPVVFVNCSGSAVAMPWAAEHVPAIVQAWYPGESGGRAVADVLFGNVNPAGRLPVTFYRSTADLPPFDDYSMANRTYRYFTGRPQFAFGHGLSYTKFNYGDLKLNAASFAAREIMKVAFTLQNAGASAGDEVAQVYFRARNSTASPPGGALCGFARIHLEQGQAARVTLEIPAARFRRWDAAKKHYAVAPGSYELCVGAAADDIRLRAAVTMRGEGG